MKPFTLALSLTLASLPLANLSHANEIAQTSSIQESVDLKKLKQEDILTDAQLDGFKLEGRWLGPTWWANRMADWGKNGDQDEILCSPNRPFLAWRVAADMTRNIDLTKGDLDIELNASLVPKGDDNAKLAKDSLVGLILGLGYSFENPKARALIFDFVTPKHGVPSVPGSGYALGLSGDGHLKILDLDAGKVLASKLYNEGLTTAPLRVTSKQQGDRVTLTLTASKKGGDISVSALVPAKRMKGGIGLLSHPGTKGKGVSTAESVFKNYKVKSGAPRINAQAVGPIVMAQYTVDRGVLKLTAQCMPNAGKEATLSFYKKGKWEQAGKSKVAELDEMASFRVENWDNSVAVPYRVSLPLSGSDKPVTYTGLIAAEPSNGKVRVAALGCIIHRPWGKPKDWNEVLYFPHDEVVNRAMAQKPDLVFFYGDQLYEGTPSYVDRKNIHEDYMYKWLLHCLAFNETVRDVPSVTIPDDHDVYQGNHWGAGARKAPNNDWNNGGYRYPGEFIAQVHRTQSGHLPDCPSPDSLEQNIPAYFCDWNYGGVSFAIVGDRLFKSGPANNGLPSSKTKRPDHYNNPDFDTAKLDLPHLELLGKPQEKFLAEWAQDWSHGAEMKAVLSQSPFGNLATHHAGQYLIADLDSNGWPQSGRKRALEMMRSVRAVHIAGDQHLSTLVQHGIENHDDAIFGFTAPAIANAYARAYHPSHKGNYYKTTPPRPEQYLGKRLDGFKNKVTFHAVANPDTRKDGPYHLPKQSNLGHQVPGFGIVDFDTNKRTITFQSLPRSGEIAKRLPNGNYPGWPKTVKQSDNDGRKVVGILAKVKVKGVDEPIVKVYNPDGTLQWAQRMTSNEFTIPAYAKGKHKIWIAKPGHIAETRELEPSETGVPILLDYTKEER